MVVFHLKLVQDSTQLDSILAFVGQDNFVFGEADEGSELRLSIFDDKVPLLEGNLGVLPGN